MNRGFARANCEFTGANREFTAVFREFTAVFREFTTVSREFTGVELRRGCYNCMGTAGCTGFQSDMRIRILATGRAAYPDASMVRGPIELDPADHSDTTITNPTLLVEVLSPSTEEVDRGSKWRDYQRIPSLQEAVRESSALNLS